MASDDPIAPRIVGGGINTGDDGQRVVVTQMLGIGNGDPVREAALRERFLSFDPLFDAASRLAAHELVLRGRRVAADAPEALRQMDEDMLLTGLYSLVQDGLTGELPLLVRISDDVLYSDLPRQLNQPGLIWCIDIDDEAQLARALVLHEAGLALCPRHDAGHPLVIESAGVWPYLACRAGDVPPATTARCIVGGVRDARLPAAWPASAWFTGSAFSGDTQPADIAHEQSVRLELLALALRESNATLAQFFRLNPDMAPRLLAIANSQAGGLSRPAESAVHALVMLGSQRARRVAALLALAGAHPPQSLRNVVVAALTRALFMGKIVRLGNTADNAAEAFEIGLLSAAPQALAISLDTLIRTLRLPATTMRALTGQISTEGEMLQLAVACENNDAIALGRHAGRLGIDLHLISVAYLDALIAASTLDAALH